MIFKISPKLSEARDLPQTLSANCFTNEALQQQSFYHQICCGFVELLVFYQ